MGTLAFRCRNTGLHVDSGVEADINGAPKLAVSAFRLRCPICDERHAWFITEGRVVGNPIPPNSVRAIVERLASLRDRLSAAA
jgi:hypothetical protein